MKTTGKRREKEHLAVPVKSVNKVTLKDDMYNIILLIFLYLLQGVPLGLTFGSIPFLLKEKLSFSDLALFSLSSYPYSLKLLWSPIVDSIFFKSIGRRKSWIIPIQIIIGLSLIMMGGEMDEILGMSEIPVMKLTIVFTTMVFLCATQDIAVDGWALTLLKEENKAYASTAQTIGLNTGYFLSFTVFLALNSSEFSNKYLRSTPALGSGVLTLGSYLQFWGVMFLICTLWLIFFNKERTSDEEIVDDIQSVYRNIFKIMMMPPRIGFIANDSVTGLKLLDKGFSKEDLALAVLVDFPLQLFFGYYAAKWSSGSRPLRPWLYAFYGRLLFSVVGMVIVYSVPETGITNSFFFLVMMSTISSSFMSTVQFVGMGSFFTMISDPTIGGTYMTLLNTVSNLGGTWPRYFILQAVESLTDAPCTFNNGTVLESIKCTNDKSKLLCKDRGGTCELIADGYYYVNSIGILIGLITLIIYIRPQIHLLEGLKTRAWRLNKKEI